MIKEEEGPSTSGSYLETRYGLKTIVKSYCNMTETVPADPETVTSVKAIKGSITKLIDLYHRAPGNCQKSYEAASAIDLDCYLYMSHLARDRPKDVVTSFPTEPNRKEWFVYEGRALEYLTLTPNLKSLKKPTGKNGWTEESAAEFYACKDRISKEWSALRRRHLPRYGTADGIWPEKLRREYRKLFHLAHYSKEEATRSCVEADAK
jgi:hypothetical protein